MINSYCVGWKTYAIGVKMKKTETLSIRIESEKLLQLENLAKREDISVSALVRRICKEYILDKWTD